MGAIAGIEREWSNKKKFCLYSIMTKVFSKSVLNSTECVKDLE